MHPTADELVDRLVARRSNDELAKVRKRLAADEEAFGVRMRELFDLAKEYADLPLDNVDRLLDHPAYEPRMAAMCILDFRARRQLADDDRRALCELYLTRHDRITTWDMVDRAAPRVVGGYLAGRSMSVLDELATSRVPLERRTAITAPLYFVRSGSDDDLSAAFTIAARLADDTDPTVYRPVGIFLKHASTRDTPGVRQLLDEHAPAMPRPALRLATEKLDPSERATYLEA